MASTASPTNHDEAHLIVPIDAEKKEFLLLATSEGDGLLRAADGLPIHGHNDVALGEAAGSSGAVRIDGYHKGAAHLPICR